jgi:hypothetical protein
MKKDDIFISKCLKSMAKNRLTNQMAHADLTAPTVLQPTRVHPPPPPLVEQEFVNIGVH